MNSIKDIYRIGNGPSSSHTIAPKRAVEFFLNKFKDKVDFIEVELLGSLALTGKGHFTDRIIEETINPIKNKIIFTEIAGESIINIKGFKNEKLIETWKCLSLGGGSVRIDKFDTHDEHEFYKENSFSDIKKVIKRKKITLLDYIYKVEPDLKGYLSMAFDQMILEIDNGLKDSGVLCKPLNVKLSAKKLYEQAISKNDNELKYMSYSYAACEQNAKGKIVVTGPTLGSCGVVSGLMYYCYKDLKIEKDKLLDALAIGGLFGNLIKKNASISGAIGGCQAEIGTACSMACAMLAYLEGHDISIIEYAAEIGLEHFLGLTCDPVMGYVIIPCIERNAVALNRVFNAVKIASNILTFKSNAVSFDEVVKTMNYTGKKIPHELKETSLGGLAIEVKVKK